MKSAKNRPFQLIKPSTHSFLREARRLQGYSLFDLLHGYVYARWPYLYIGIGVGEHPFAKKWLPRLVRLLSWLPGRSVDRALTNDNPESISRKQSFADTYHGKVLPLEPAKRLVSVSVDINLPDLEQVIPYKRARSIILKNPDHIAVLQCPCRAARPNPCLPLEVCLIVGEPFASFVVEHHPERARRIEPQQAVRILEEEDQRGHVHHAFFKDAMLGRFYAICNCCACCCGAMQAHRNGTPMLASSGYICQVDEMLCTGCEVCVDHCQFGALSLQDGISSVNQTLCMGCGVCVGQCEQGALSLQLEPKKGLPLDICELLQFVPQVSHQVQEMWEISVGSDR